MDQEQKLSRRDFLRLSALTAASAVITACGGQAAPPPATPAAGAPTAAPGATTAPAATPAATTAPVAAPGKYKEAPMLAEQVKAGKLPPVDQRLPKNPYVPPHAWLQVGKYGGTMNWVNSWGGDNISVIVHESMYGHSPLRWLKDGQEIGPGLVESWESNDDASQWTLHFREGLKWSDGQPWTVDDIMFWWEDMILNEEHNTEAPPDEARSGKGTLAKFEKVDDYTLRMTFDAPAPLTADRLAMWVNGNAGKPIGPSWMAPKHYLQQFHPKYNSSVTGNWVETFNQKAQFRINPECPTMTGWMLQTYEEGVRSVWTRNPYYWVVDKDGNQLPYIDTIICTGYQDAQVEKLNVLSGKADFTHHWVLNLTDVSAARQGESTGNFEVRFWDSGSGSGQSFFFNFDYKDDKMRELIRNPKFRKALSHAYNRAEIQKNFYFGQGELTTGTFAPKAIEYNINDQGKQVYIAWRDSAVKYDPELAKQLLDEIGVVDKDGDGKREMPDGSKLTVTLDYGADAAQEAVSTNELLARDWQAIGIDARINPMPPQGLTDLWKGGEKLSNANWGIGDGPNHLVFPQWLVPIEYERWAPLHGTYYSLRGTPEETAEQDVNPWERKPPRIGPKDAAFSPAIGKLWEIYDRSKVEPDFMKRTQMVWDMIKIHIEEGPFVQGSVANFPRAFIVKKGLLNVPKREDLALGGFTDPWIHPTPAVYDPETWFWDDPAAHGG